MKLVIAIIKPFKIDDVLDAVTRQGINGMTLTEVKGYGRQKGHTEIYRGAEYVVRFLPKLRVEIAVHDDQADSVITAIQTRQNWSDWRWQDFCNPARPCAAHSNRRNR